MPFFDLNVPGIKFSPFRNTSECCRQVLSDAPAVSEQKAEDSAAAKAKLLPFWQP